MSIAKTPQDSAKAVKESLEQTPVRGADAANDAAGGALAPGVTLLDAANGIDAEVLAQKLDKVIKELNEDHFVSEEGGRTFVYRVGVCRTTGVRKLKRFTQQSFIELRRNQKIWVPAGATGQARLVPVGVAWLESPNALYYPEGIDLLPGQDTPKGVYNLWQGFGVEPKQGDVRPAMRHILDVVCDGDRAVFEYLVKWMAFCVQRPGDMTGVAVVMRGGEGTGKGTVAYWMRDIFGEHGRRISQTKHLTGNFNEHLRGVCFLFADEAFFVGDRAGGNVLKGLVTDPTLMIEPKGVDAFEVPNRLKIMMASNEEWVIPAGADARRYLVLDMSDRYKQDHEYFEALQNHMYHGGGIEALLHYLLHGVNLDGFNVRSAPKTAALDRQKELSLGLFPRWLHDRLYEGRWHDPSAIAPAAEWDQIVPCSKIVNAFAESIKGRHGAQYENTSAKRIGVELRKVFPDLQRYQTREGTRLQRVWKFPPLDEARRQFERAYFSGNPQEWPDEADDLEPEK